MERASDRWQGKRGTLGMLAVALTAWVAMLGLTGCGGAVTEAEFTFEPAYEPAPPGEVRVGGESLPVRLLHTAVQRRYEAEQAAFTAADGSSRGLLYVFPAESSVRFNPNVVDFATSLAFLDEDGEVLHLEEVPATPREDDDAMGFGPMRASGTFPFAAGEEVRFLLQVPSNYFSARGLEIGDTVSLPEEQLQELGEEGLIEEDRPVATLLYERLPDLAERGGNPADAIASARFSVRVADTQESRDELLSPQGVASLQAHEMGYVRWEEPRPISISARHGFDRSFFIVPFEVTEQEQNPVQLGPLVELRPLEQRRRFEMYSPAWSAVSARRNWEYRSQEAYDGYLLFGYDAVRELNLVRQRNAFGLPSMTFLQGDDINIELPLSLLRKPAEPRPSVLELEVHVADEAHHLPVRIVDSHDERVRGLRLESALPTAEELAQRAESEQEEPAQTEEAQEAEPRPQAYWLRFDEQRPRPTLTGGLPAPYDILYLDSEGVVVAVRRNVTDRTTVYPHSTEFLRTGGRLRAYQSLLLVPAGWVEWSGMIVERDGAQRLALANLHAPASVRFEWPEPERYPMSVDGQEIEVEVAYNEFDRQRGLMWRRDLPDDGGMIFLFRDEETRRFHMLNCLIDLTTAFITDGGDNRSGEVATIVNMYHPVLPAGENPRIQAEEPPFSRAFNEQQLADQSNRHYGSQVPVRYVLEMPYNWFRKHGVQEEAQIELGEVLQRYLEIAE